MICYATENDLEAILAIYNDAILNTTAVYTYQASTLKERKHWFQSKQEEGFPLWVYKSDGKVTGFATYGSFRAWPAYKYTIEHSIYVDPLFHHRGIRTALLNTIIEDANAKGYATIVAGIDASPTSTVYISTKN